MTYGIMYYLFQANTPETAPLFHTAWFVESLLSQTLVIHIIRTNRRPFLESRASLPLTITTLLICSIALWLPVSPFAHSLGFVTLPWTYWPVLVALIGGYLALVRFVKTRFVRKYGWG